MSSEQDCKQQIIRLAFMVLNHAYCVLMQGMFSQRFSSPLFLTDEEASNTFLMPEEESSTMKDHRAHRNIIHLIKKLFLLSQNMFA